MIEAPYLDQARIQFDEHSLWVMNMALGLVMFGISLNLTIGDFKQLWRAPKPVLAGLVSQFVALPLVTFLLVSWLIRTKSSFQTLLFVLALQLLLLLWQQSCANR